MSNWPAISSEPSLADADVVQPRGLAAAQHAGSQVEQRFFRRVRTGHVPGAVDARLRHPILQDAAVAAAALGDPGLLVLERRSGRDVAVVLLDLLARLRRRDVAGQHQHHVVRAVIIPEPGLDVGHRGGVQVGHGADHGMRIRVVGRPGVLGHGLVDQAVGLVLVLALLVLHDAALQVELLLVEHAEQMAHAVAFGEQRIVEHRGRHGLEVIGAVGVGGAVQVGRADAFKGRQIGLVEVLAAREHQVFEQVGEAGLAGRLVLGTDVVPGVDGHHRRFMVLVHQHRQAVLQHEFGVGDVRNRDVDLGGRFGGGGGNGLDGGGQCRHRGQRCGQGQAQRRGTNELMHAIPPMSAGARLVASASDHSRTGWRNCKGINFFSQILH
jgi:hypothetical protein